MKKHKCKFLKGYEHESEEHEYNKKGKEYHFGIYKTQIKGMLPVKRR